MEAGSLNEDLQEILISSIQKEFSSHPRPFRNGDPLLSKADLSSSSSSLPLSLSILLSVLLSASLSFLSAACMCYHGNPMLIPLFSTVRQGDSTNLKEDAQHYIGRLNVPPDPLCISQ